MPPINVPVFFENVLIPGFQGEINLENGAWLVTFNHIIDRSPQIEARIREVVGHGPDQVYDIYEIGPEGIHFGRVEDLHHNLGQDNAQAAGQEEFPFQNIPLDVLLYGAPAAGAGGLLTPAMLQMLMKKMPGMGAAPGQAPTNLSAPTGGIASFGSGLLNF